MVENVNTPSSARIGRRGLNRRELLGADLAGATIVAFPMCPVASPHRVSNSGSSTRLAAGVPSQDNWFDGIVKAWNDSHEVKIQLVYVPTSAYMDGTKLPTAFASGTVQYPRVASYSVSSRTPLAKAILIRRG